MVLPVSELASLRQSPPLLHQSIPKFNSASGVKVLIAPPKARAGIT